MGHDREHPSGPHSEHPVAPFVDPSVADGELSPADVSRRSFLRRIGLATAGAGAWQAAAVPSATARPTGPLEPPGAPSGHPGAFRWLAGDHHVHTQYSYDGLYTVGQQAAAGTRHGLDWMVITDHGHAAHEKLAVERTYADVLAARAGHPRLLLWQGLEWNMPGAEHATLLFAGARDEALALRTFERLFDSRVNGTGASTPANEAAAVAAIRWLSGQVDAGRIRSALLLANHTSRNGRISPHELRAWRDADPRIAVGMEGAPGAQADGMPAPRGNGGSRGGYANTPGPDSWPGYPPEAYRTFGGFDWTTATVGGLWDAMLAEGRGWWITANSDSHANFGDTHLAAPGGDYDGTGRLPDPVDSGRAQTHADFAPGQFSRTVVGASRRDLASVMAGIRAGRVWVCMGGLVEDLRVLVVAEDPVPGGYATTGPVTLGGRVRVRRGGTVRLRVTGRQPARPNGGGSVPAVARLDVIDGAVTGAPADPDVFTAPRTRLAASFEPSRVPGASFAFTFTLPGVSGPRYLRVRGTDGNHHAPGGLEPRADVPGDADPWADLWFYTNPVFIDVE